MIVYTAEQAISRLPHVQLDSSFPPEEIVRMIMAGGVSQTVYNISSGIHQRAVEFLCQQTHLVDGYPIEGGIIQEDRKGRPYFVAGTKAFPANRQENEFLGILAAAGINFNNTTIVSTSGAEGSLMEMVEKAMSDYHGVVEEPAWSLMLFSVFPGVTQDWKNAEGQFWNVETILSRAITRPYGVGICLGTHIVEGIAFAVSRYCLEQDVEPAQLTGIWEKSYQYVLNSARLMRQNQKSDGSIDRCWFREKKYPRSLLEWKEKFRDLTLRRFRPARAILYPTGHCLDAISAVAGFWTTDREWIDNASYILAHTIDTQWADMAHDVSNLTHAIHAVKLLGM